MPTRNRADALREYVWRMRRACAFGVLTQDLYAMDSWLRHEVEALDQVMLDLIVGPGDFQDSVAQIKELLHEVLAHKCHVEGVIQQGRAYLRHDDDALLRLDVACLERHWGQLKSALHALNPNDPLNDPRTRPLDNPKYPIINDNLSKPSISLPEEIPYPNTPRSCSLESIASTSSLSSLIIPRLELLSERISNRLVVSKRNQEENLRRPNSTETVSVSSLSSASLLESQSSCSDDPFGASCSSGESFASSSLSGRKRKHCNVLDNHPEHATAENLNFSAPPESDTLKLESFEDARILSRRLRNEGSKMSKPVDIAVPRGRSPAMTSLRIPSSPLQIANTNLRAMKSNFPSSLGDISGEQSPTSQRLSPRSSPFNQEDSPVLSKRRRMNTDTPSPPSSPLGSLSALQLQVDPSLVGLDSFDDSGSRTFDEFSDSNVSSMGSPSGSPSPYRKGPKPLKRYRKDELWAAIRSDYQYLMDEEIIETCKFLYGELVLGLQMPSSYLEGLSSQGTGVLDDVEDWLLKQVWPHQTSRWYPSPSQDPRNRSTESDFSWESDDLTTTTKVSFAEFVQQYKELTDWLNQIQLVTQRQSSSLSEKYLNQTYHEEMLQRSPRRKLFNDYAKQLMRRYPSMKEEISVRLGHLNQQWELLQSAISPQHGYLDEETMLKDLEQDLNGLRKWLHEVESQLLPLCLDSSWTADQLRDKLKEHQVLQLEIESHSKIVSAVLKLCERLQGDQRAYANDDEKDSLQLVAVHLERRWHAIWLQSLEWQCRLEEAIKSGIPVRRDVDDWEGSYYGLPNGASLTRPQGFHGSHDGALSDATDCTGEQFDSDQSDCDVIPFLEYEYEKITVDTDVQTDGFFGKVTPSSSSIASSSGREEGCDHDQGFDSALGRSVSDDHSLNTEPPGCLVQQPGLSRTTPKVVSFACDMKAIEDPSDKQRAKMENPDVGYSSESHSNDEPDYGSGLAASPSLDGMGGAAAARKGLSLDEVVLRRKVETDSTDATPSPSKHEKSWRHSMTSAYDSCSNCSDLNSTNDLELSLGDTTADTTTDSVATVLENGELSPAEDSIKVKKLVSSPTGNFYRMTSVEDVESAANARASGETAGWSDGEPALSPRFHLSHSTPIKPSLDNIRKPKVSRRLLVGELEPSPILEINLGKCRSDSLDVEVDSEACVREEALTLDDLDLLGLPGHQQDSTDSIHHLIQQADLLVRETDTGRAINKRRKKKACRQRRRTVVEAPVPDLLAVPQEEGRQSACDASSEGSSSSESESEYSTASSETDDRLPSTTSSPSMSQNNLNSIAAQASAKLRALAKSRDRPCSITELYELTNRLDLSPFSISESAIDDIARHHRAMQPNSCAQLRRANSDAASIPVRRYESPRKRRRKLKRRSSDDTDPASHLATSPSSKSVCSVPQCFSSQEWLTPHASSSDVNTELLRRSLEAIVAAHPVGSESEVEVGGVSLLHRDLGCESDDTDGVMKSMNSTMESFSENAWDNYQDNPYPSISDDPNEEKLDDSALQWEGLELEDCAIDCTFIPKEKRLSCTAAPTSLYGLDTSRVEDSDSDLEDLHDVFTQSCRQIRITENALKRPQKDSLGTGISLEPLKYGELLATCRTNMKCLEVVSEALHSGEAPELMCDEDIQDITDIVERWQELESLALARQIDSRELSQLAGELSFLLNTIHDHAEDIDTADFGDVTDLEAVVKGLQDSKLALQQLRANVSQLEAGVMMFTKAQPLIPMSGFRRQLEDLQQTLHYTVTRCGARSCELQSCLISWYDFNETCKELSYLLSGELRQLDCLSVIAPNLARIPQPDLLHMIAELKAVQSELAVYKSKLGKLYDLSSELAAVCDETTRVEQAATLSGAEGQLVGIQGACEDMLSAMEAHKSPKVDAATGVQDDLDSVQPQQRCQYLMRLLRATMPVQVALMVALGLAYLLEPEMGDLGLTLNPQLRYVRGPPPI